MIQTAKNENPYSASATNPILEPSENGGDKTTLQSIARDVFLAWEKLRIVYVIILALITLSLTGISVIGNWRLMQLIVEGAIAANIAYFAGPTVETYVRWLGYKRAWPRWVMFGGGTLIAIILAVVTIASQLFPVNLNALGGN